MSRLVVSAKSHPQSHFLLIIFQLEKKDIILKLERGPVDEFVHRRVVVGRSSWLSPNWQIGAMTVRRRRSRRLASWPALLRLIRSGLAGEGTAGNWPVGQPLNEVRWEGG